MPTIIGAESFHGPVRDGKEWCQLAMVVRRSLMPGGVVRPTDSEADEEVFGLCWVSMVRQGDWLCYDSVRVVFAVASRRSLGKPHVQTVCVVIHRA